MHIINKKNINLINIFIFLTIFIMILSQTNIIIFRKIMYLMYISIFGALLIKNKFKVYITKFMRAYIIVSGTFILYMLSIYIFNNSYRLQIIDVFIISLSMYVLGVQIANVKSKVNLLKVIMLAYVCGAIALSIYIRINYFTTISSWLGAMENIYAKKNSAGQILTLALIILIFYFSNLKTKQEKLIKFVSICILSYTLILIQSRAVIIALIGSLVFYFFCIKKKKIKIIIILGISIIILLSNNYTWAIINKFFYFNKYAGGSLNDFSSNRFEWYYEALIKWKESPLLGLGISYVDNLYLNILTSGGILGFLIIIPVWIYRAIINFKIYINYKNNINKIILIIVMMTIFMIIESMLEGFPPFGPGVCSFIFWVVCGYWDGKNKI